MGAPSTEVLWRQVIKFLVYFNLGAFLVHTFFGSVYAGFTHFAFGLLGAAFLAVSDDGA